MRYVVLRHELPEGHPRAGVHYDLMLEHRGRLLTWALPRPPQAGVAQPAERLADHRLDYLDYEGPVSGDRGRVARWDRGPMERLDVAAARVAAVLGGPRLQARVTLAQSADEQWTATFEPLA